MNHKRVYRWMRADNLLCLRKRKFVVTTDSDHGLRVYPNLARTLTLTGLDQLWVADLTYIRLELEFVYLAVILDALHSCRACLRFTSRLPSCSTRPSLYNRIPANGEQCLTCLSQPWGPLHEPAARHRGLSHGLHAFRTNTFRQEAFSR